MRKRISGLKVTGKKWRGCEPRPNTSLVQNFQPGSAPGSTQKVPGAAPRPAAAGPLAPGSASLGPPSAPRPSLPAPPRPPGPALPSLGLGLARAAAGGRAAGPRGSSPAPSGACAVSAGSLAGEDGERRAGRHHGRGVLRERGRARRRGGRRPGEGHRAARPAAPAAVAVWRKHSASPRPPPSSPAGGARPSRSARGGHARGVSAQLLHRRRAAGGGPQP